MLLLQMDLEKHKVGLIFECCIFSICCILFPLTLPRNFFQCILYISHLYDRSPVRVTGMYLVYSPHLRYSMVYKQTQNFPSKERLNYF